MYRGTLKGADKQDTGHALWLCCSQWAHVASSEQVISQHRDALAPVTGLRNEDVILVGRGGMIMMTTMQELQRLVD